eukprot:5290911-Pyramimonas_sp.AAC.1
MVRLPDVAGHLEKRRQITPMRWKFASMRGAWPQTSDHFLLQWRHMPRNTLLASRVPWVSCLRWFCHRRRGVPTPNINGRPG